MNSWLRYSSESFPLIFCQAMLAIARGQDENFKKGAIEFIRNLSVKKPEYCNIIGGYKILINSLLDDNLIDISDNIFYTLLYLINNSDKRIFLNNINDFYKIFSIFTKSDYKDKDKEISNDERNKLEVQLALSKRVIEKLLKTWPGYSLLMGNFMAFSSIIESLNTDTNIIIKKTILDLLNDLIENEYNTCDNFTCLVVGDEFFINKIYLAYILQGLFNNKLYFSLIKFIEKENNPLRDYAYKITLKFIILYSKLTNMDLQLPFLSHKVYKFEPHKIEEDIINTKIKIMNLLEQTYYHYNTKELSHMELKDLSDIVVLAMNSVVNMQNIKKYVNQYSTEVSKKELYMIDDNSFQQILKNSRILESKDFNEWDWKRLDEVLDIVEYRKELSIYY
jgi:hypothetical protein